MMFLAQSKWTSWMMQAEGGFVFEDDVVELGDVESGW